MSLWHLVLCVCVYVCGTSRDLGGLASGHIIALHHMWSLSNSRLVAANGSISLMFSPLIRVHTAILRKLRLLHHLPLLLSLSWQGAISWVWAFEGSMLGSRRIWVHDDENACAHWRPHVFGFGFTISPAGLRKVFGSTSDFLEFIFTLMLNQQQDNGCLFYSPEQNLLTKWCLPSNSRADKQSNHRASIKGRFSVCYLFFQYVYPIFLCQL